MNTSFAFQRYFFAALLFLAALPFLMKIGESSIWDSNEAFYAQTPREMIDRADYINPSFNYQPRFNKPPLVYWVVALSYKVFGVSEGAERLPIALGALVMIATAFLLAREMFSTEAGLVAAIVLAATPRFLMFSRRIIIDVYLAMFIGLAMLLFLLADKYPQRRRLFSILMYVSIGLGILTKGPVALLLPAVAIFIFLAVQRRLTTASLETLPLGFLIISAIVLPWYGAIYSEHGLQYIKAFLLDDNLSRYTQPVWGPRRGFLFYIPVLAGDLLPWSVFLAPAIWQVIRGGRRPPDPLVASTDSSAPPNNGQKELLEAKPLKRNPYGLFLLIWIAVIVLFFSLSRSKEDLYVLPMYPAAAALVGGFLVRTRKNESALAMVIILTIAGLLIASLGGGLSYLLTTLAPVYEIAGARVIGSLALAGGLLAAFVALTKRCRLAIGVLAITLVAINWIFVLRSLPDFERYRPVRALCEVINANARSDAMVGYYKIASPSMVFYLQRPIFEFYRPEELSEAFTSDNEVYCLMTGADYEAVKETIPVETMVLASRATFQVKLRSIFERAESPRVLLISNKPGPRSGE